MVMYFLIVRNGAIFMGIIFCSSVVLVWTFNTRGVYDFITKKANISINLVPFFNGVSFLYCRFLKSGVTNELKSPEQKSGVTNELKSPEQKSGVTNELKSPEQKSGVTNKLKSPEQKSGVTNELNIFPSKSKRVRVIYSKHSKSLLFLHYCMEDHYNYIFFKKE